MATRTLQIVLAGDTSSASRAFRRTEQDAQRMGKTLDREGKRVHGFASITGKGFSRVGLAASSMQAIAGGAAVVMAKSFLDSATSINESLTKNQVLFGKHAATVDQFSRRTATSLGISRRAALEATGTFGNLFTALEVGPRQSAKMSVALTKLAGDLASFNNASPDDALEAIRSGLVGETEPLRRFGVNLNDATLRAEALRMGLVKTTKESLEPQTRALAVNSLLFRQTEKAQGDFARTSGGLANQQRILKARLSDIGSELGARLMPFALKAAGALNDLITETQRGRGPLIRLKDGVEGVIGAVRDAVGWFRRHRTTTDVLISAVAGLTAAFVAYKVATIAAAVATRGLAAASVLLNVAMRANPIGLVVTAIIALGTALVMAYKRSEKFREIVDLAFTVVKSQARQTARVFNTVLLPVFKAVVDAAGAVGRALNKVGGGLGLLADPARGAAKLFGGIGDGLGKTAQDMASIPRFGGGLMGARPELGPIAGLASRFGLGVSSGLRPGARTSSGNQSWHATGEAIDVSGPSSGMMGFARFMSKRAGSLAELIYTPLGAWDNGSRYTPTGKLAADHYDHVHVAMDVGAPGQGDGIGQATNAARAAGFRGQNLINAVAIAGAESKYDAQAKNLKYPDHSIGMWQINQLAHKGRYGSDAALMSPFANARAAFAISGGGRNFGPWSTWPSAARDWMARARAAVQGTAGGRGGGGGGATGGGNVGGGGHGSVTGGSGNTVSGVGSTSLGPLMGLGFEGKLARNQVAQARAEARDDLSGMIKALVAERALKRKRLKLINKVLGGRLSRERRTRLLQEKAQLIGEIGDLTDTIKEYKADRAGGATTITAADALEAGVDTFVDTGGAGADTGGGGAAEADPNVALLAQLTGEMVANQNRLIRLMETQGPQLLAGVVAAVNGGIGGKLGLGGLQAAGVPGQLARY